jgi:hypothetical protein
MDPPYYLRLPLPYLLQAQRVQSPSSSKLPDSRSRCGSSPPIRQSYRFDERLLPYHHIHVTVYEPVQQLLVLRWLCKQAPKVIGSSDFLFSSSQPPLRMGIPGSSVSNDLI